LEFWRALFHDVDGGTLAMEAASRSALGSKRALANASHCVKSALLATNGGSW
jgi:hypothetical protein